MVFSEIIGLVVTIGIIVFLAVYIFSVSEKFSIINPFKKQKEKYSSSAMTHIGGLSDYNKISEVPPETTDKEIMDKYNSTYNPFTPVQRTPIKMDHVNEHFDNSIPNLQPESNTNDMNFQSWNEQRTIDRLDRVDKNLIPHTSQNVTPYNVDVADPVSYSFQVHAPRVIRKDRMAMEADPLRGDIPISIYPDVPIIEKSQYNRDSLRLDGTFSDALAKSYDRLSGKTYFNTPASMSTGAIIM